MMGECEESSVSAQSTLRGPMILAKVITDALDNKKRGESSDYGAVIEHLSASGMKADGMRRWLHALRLCVSRLGKEHDRLVSTTLKFLWFNQSSDIVSLYVDYLTSLLSAQTCYLRSVLQGLVSQLCQPAPQTDTAESAGVAYTYLNIHRAIEAVLELVPTATSLLATLLTKHFPFKGKSPEIQELALRNVLHISTYCPTLTDSILELAVHQMLLIDVEVPSQALGDGEGEGLGDEDVQFHVEMEETGDAPIISDTLAAVLSRRPVMASDMAEKLDIMMTICFEYFYSLCHSNDVLVLDSAIGLFKSLLKIFESVLLPTHASSHVQFLLFKVTSYHKSFPNHFLEFLWERFESPSTPTVLRQSCAAYMASYIARANFVSLETAKLSLSIMVQWIHQYIDGCSPELMRPEVKHHAVFFSLSQAVFYIFVFRHKSLIEMPGGVSFLRQLNLERIVSSRLNPLKICLPSVVELFAELTSRYELLFCYTILEQNKRLVLSTGSFVGGSGSGAGATVTAAQTANPLDCFFPFDPYSLKRSRRYIEGLYTEWEEEEEVDDTEQVSGGSSPLSSSPQSSGCFGSTSSHPPLQTHSMTSTLSFSLSPS